MGTRRPWLVIGYLRWRSRLADLATPEYLSRTGETDRDLVSERGSRDQTLTGTKSAETIRDEVPAWLAGRVTTIQEPGSNTSEDWHRQQPGDGGGGGGTPVSGDGSS